MLCLGLSKDTVAYLTFGLALLLVFRVGQSYTRYNDARVKWGMMVNRTRDLSRQFFCYVDDTSIASRANRWIISYVYACKQSLRWKKQCDELSHTLSDDELAGLNAAKHMPVYCMPHESRTRNLMTPRLLPADQEIMTVRISPQAWSRSRAASATRCARGTSTRSRPR
jgi:hypothetical protein